VAPVPGKAQIKVPPTSVTSPYPRSVIHAAVTTIPKIMTAGGKMRRTNADMMGTLPKHNMGHSHLRALRLLCRAAPKSFVWIRLASQTQPLEET
jgi:hypothetical protein